MLHVPLSRRHNVDVENPTSTLDETLHTYIEDNKQEILRNTRYTWFGIITYVYGGKGTILLLDSRLRKVYLTSKLSSLSTKLLVFSSLTEFPPPPPPPHITVWVVVHLSCYSSRVSCDASPDMSSWTGWGHLPMCFCPMLIAWYNMIRCRLLSWPDVVGTESYFDQILLILSTTLSEHLLV